MPGLVLGPILRYADEGQATVSGVATRVFAILKSGYAANKIEWDVRRQRPDVRIEDQVLTSGRHLTI